MACKITHKNGFTRIECNPGSFDYLAEQQRQEMLKPYADDECRHDKRFEHKGYLTCQDCGMVYDERYGGWVPRRDND